MREVNRYYRAARRWWPTATLAALLCACSMEQTAEDEIVTLLESDAAYHTVTEQHFARLGWDLPDGGHTVKELADDELVRKVYLGETFELKERKRKLKL